MGIPRQRCVVDTCPAALGSATLQQRCLINAGQRRVNLIWECTQAFIAVIVVLANMVAGIFNVLHQTPEDPPMILSSSLFLIVGFYFSRTNGTNHSAIGGVRAKPSEQKNQGR